MFAVGRHDAEEVVAVLLKAGADTKAKNNQGKTALDVALESHTTPAVIDLLEAATK